MEAIVFNGSPRKNRNTATLLDHALKGTVSQGTETALIHLYGFSCQGCISCFERREPLRFTYLSGSNERRDAILTGEADFPVSCVRCKRLHSFPQKNIDWVHLYNGCGRNPHKKLGYEQIFENLEPLFVTETYQFDDYSKYEAPLFDPEEKAKKRREGFPNDCSKAFDMGTRLAKNGTNRQDNPNL